MRAYCKHLNLFLLRNALFHLFTVFLFHQNAVLLIDSICSSPKCCVTLTDSNSSSKCRYTALLSITINHYSSELDSLRVEVQSLQQEVISLHESQRRRNEHATPSVSQRSARGITRPGLSSGKMPLFMHSVDLFVYTHNVILYLVAYFCKRGRCSKL